MGWSYTDMVGKTLEAMEAAAAKHGGTSNEFADAKGNRYFYEVHRREYADGHVTGSVLRLYEGGMAEHAGNFTVYPDGKLRAPLWMRQAFFPPVPRKRKVAA